MPRATKSRASKTDAPSEQEIARLVAGVAAEVRKEGSVACSALARLGVAKSAREAVLDGARRAGLEVTPRAVRIPLREQLASRLEAGGALLLKTLSKAVTGATKSEAEAALRELCNAGRARRVVRGVEVSVVGASAHVVDDDALDRLERAITDVAKSIALARKKKATLLQKDVAGALAALGAPAERERPFPRGAPSFVDVLVGVDRHREGSGLTFVPRLVRALGIEACEAVHAALLQGAKRGVLELRPESGMGRLSPEDLRLCLAGPQGSRLSWVRRIEEQA